MLDRPVRFSCRECLPADALVQLSRAENINIVFSDRFFQRCPPVTIEAAQVPMRQVLDQISACARVSYRLVGEQIVFYRKTARFTLSGYILDADTGERLIGATIRVEGQRGIGAVSNEFGFYSLTLDEGRYTLYVSYIGYENQRLELTLQTDQTLTAQLKPRGALPEVVVSAPRSRILRGNGDNGRNLPLSMLRNLPMPGGEADLTRLAGLQPGVQTGVDGLGGLHIRGGNADHNLILLDDVPVYNPSHALGLFSIFNPGAVSQARLWKGDFPARYGGRVASVLDVRTRDGNLREHQAAASIGLFASSLIVEGPIVQDKSSFLVAVRGTYFDPWMRLLRRQGDLLNFDTDQSRYRFFDANFKFNYAFTERDRLYFSYYRGGDFFKNQFEQRYIDPTGLITDKYELASDWGNEIAALRWNRVWGSRLFSNTTLRYSLFNYESRLQFKATRIDFSGRINTLDNYAQLYQTLIRDWSGKTDFTYFLHDQLTLRWGAAITLHNFKPGTLSVNFLSPGQTPNSIDSLSNLLRNNQVLGADESEFYVDAEWRPWRNWQVEAGLNFLLFQVRNRTYGNLQPRLRILRQGRRGWSQWAGYHRAAQNLHQIGSFNINLPFELWVPTTDKVLPEEVWLATAGMGWQRGSWSWRIEGYYKELERVLSFLSANNALFTGGAEDASGWEDRVATGTGYSRGIEFLLEKTAGRTSGSIAYTLSESVREFPDINSGRPFPFRFDRRHDFKITLRQRLNSWLDADVVWAYATGNPITLSGVKFRHQSPDGSVDRGVFVYTDVNGYRLPPYHRLDLALNAHFTTARLQHAVQLGAYNVYNRNNPFFLYLDAGSGERGKAIQYTLLPILPVLRYELRL